MEISNFNIELFSISACKVIALNLLCFIFAVISLLRDQYRKDPIYKLDYKLAITFANCKFGIAITKWRAIEKSPFL